MANKHMKICSTSYVIKEMQIIIDTTTHLSEQPKFRTLTPNAEKRCGARELFLLLVGMQISTATLEDTLAN